MMVLEREVLHGMSWIPVLPVCYTMPSGSRLVIPQARHCECWTRTFCFAPKSLRRAGGTILSLVITGRNYPHLAVKTDRQKPA